MAHEADETAAVLDVVASLVAADAYGDAERYLKSSSLSDQAKLSVSKQVSDDLLLAKELEWTSHGIKRTFRFWTDNQKRDYLQHCLRVVSDLKELTPNVCFGFGAVLGFVREGGLIAHDDDADVIVALPSSSGLFAEDMLPVIEHLQTLGYTVGPRKSHLHVRKGDQPVMDVFVGYEGGAYVNWRPGPRDTILFSTVFPSRFETVYNLDLPVPNATELYLEQVYGSTWRTPLPGHRHKWNVFTDRMAPKTPEKNPLRALLKAVRRVMSRSLGYRP